LKSNAIAGTLKNILLEEEKENQNLECLIPNYSYLSWLNIPSPHIKLTSSIKYAAIFSNFRTMVLNYWYLFIVSRSTTTFGNPLFQ